MEPIRKRALIEAAVAAIHERGFCDVTVGQIARRAGVSPALAHHYFGSKEHLLTATMRHLLAELGRGIVARLHGAATPRARISAVISGNFSPGQFRPAVISAWLAFYVQAQAVPEARRLHRIYARRLRSGLVHDLSRLVARERAIAIAEGAAALIDGIWLRQVLSDSAPDGQAAIATVEDYVETQLARGLQ
jgi:TetR/AcrR family transcriptional regulator, transcriptional repressor of bet genes